jgi:curli biogenesis system outer membrane secretion channel CsgG
MGVALLLGALTGCDRLNVRPQDTAPSLFAARTQTGKPRIAVGGIIDKSGDSGNRSLARQLVLVNLHRPDDQVLTQQAFSQNLQTLLTTELVNSNRFIVLDRSGLSATVAEQVFNESGAVSPQALVKTGDLEGAEFLLFGAITGFDAGTSGGAIPIPIPYGLDLRHGFGILNVGYKRGYIAMDIRVVEVRTGRVVKTAVVEGSNTNFGVNLDSYIRAGNTAINLPGLLSGFQNTPIEQALQKMVVSAVSVLN